ncbi:MAG: hypothetical protein KIC74_09760 [Neisseria sp.]|uniref:hypothetical protein n=1 Tax=Neisseria mucosa TaxID=488 RepID=UPI000D33ED72|nr:hypothetical protein [Neisseria sp.]
MGSSEKGERDFRRRLLWVYVLDCCLYRGLHRNCGGFPSIRKYSGLTLNQYGVASPCRTICTVCGFVALS